MNSLYKFKELPTYTLVNIADYNDPPLASNFANYLQLLRTYFAC